MRACRERVRAATSGHDFRVLRFALRAHAGDRCMSASASLPSLALPAVGAAPLTRASRRPGGRSRLFAAAAAVSLALAVAGCGGGGGSTPAPPPPPQPPIGPLAWGEITTLATAPAAVGQPAAAADAAGTVAVLWSQTGVVPRAGDPPSANPYVVSRENTAAGGWASVLLIDTPAAGDAATDRVSGLQTLGGAPALSAAWVRMPAAGAAPNDAVRSARRSGAGIWDARVAAAGVSGLARSELTGASNAAGVQALAWVEPVGGVPQVQLRVRAAGAAVWTAPALPVQTSASLAGGSPALAIDSQGRVAIVWRQLVNGAGELRSRTLDAATLVYSSELPVDSGQPDMRNPRLIAYGDNKFLVTWEQLAGTVYELRSKTGTQAAWLAGARRIDSRVESVSAALVLADPGETALALWQQAGQLFASRWASATGNWSLPVPVPGSSGAVDLRAGSDANGRAILVWRQPNSTAGHDLVYAVASGALPTLSAVTLLEVADGSVSAPALAVGSGGAAAVTWLQAIAGQSQPNVVTRVLR
jgi:hypothetical protein